MACVGRPGIFGYGRRGATLLLAVALLAVVGCGPAASAGGSASMSLTVRATNAHGVATHPVVAASLAALGAATCPTAGQSLAPGTRSPLGASAAARAIVPVVPIVPIVPVGAASHAPAASLQQPTSAPTISATAGYLFDPTTGQVLFEQNATQELAMASTTKIMTTLTALTFGSLSQRITIGPDTVAMQNGFDSVAGLKLGDALTLCDLLYALLLPSGDDAAVAIAEGVGGTQARFVAEMNAEAALLGLWRTHYSNPDGLDQAGHYTTARDLAQLAAYAMSIPVFAQIVGTATYTLPQTADHQAYFWQTTNYLLTPTNYYPGATGVKTGTTGNAGACLVFSAARNGRQLIGVVLNEPTDAGRFTDAAALLDWGFAQGG